MRNFKNKIYKSTFSLFLLFLLTAGIFAQTENPTPQTSPTPSDRERELEEKKRIKTLEKDIAEAEQAIRDAQPKPSTTPLEGDSELTSVKIESDMVTYRAVAGSLGKIADVIRQKADDAQVIVLYSPQDMANVDAYRASKRDFTGQIDALKNRYSEINVSYCRTMGCGTVEGENKWREVVRETFTQKSANNRFDRNPASLDSNKMNEGVNTGQSALNVGSTILDFLNPVTGTLGAVADALALFRTDTTITGQTVSVKEESLVSEISRIFRDRNMSIYYPQKYLPLLDTNNQSSMILTKLKELDDAKKAAEKDVFKYQFAIESAIGKLANEKARHQRKIDSIDKYITELVALRVAAKTLKEKKQMQDAIRDEEGSKSYDEGQIRQIDEKLVILNIGKFHMEKLREVNTDARTFVSSLMASSDGKPSKMYSFLKAERLLDIQKDKKYYWLEMEAVSTGGNNRTRKNLILYFTGAKIDHSGGAIISWKLYNPDGSIRYSGIDQQYDGYKSAKTIRKQQKPSGNQTSPNVTNQVGGNNQR